MTVATKVQMLDWPGEPLWTILQEGPQASLLKSPIGLERIIPNHWFKPAQAATSALTAEGPSNPPADRKGYHGAPVGHNRGVDKLLKTEGKREMDDVMDKREDLASLPLALTTTLAKKAKVVAKIKKPAKAKKAAKVSKSKAKAKRPSPTKTRYGAPWLRDDTKIKQVANPYREGSEQWRQLELVKKGTVAKFKAGGGVTTYLTAFIRKGHALRVAG